jgi:exosortase A
MSLSVSLPHSLPFIREGWRVHLAGLVTLWAFLLILFRGDAADIVRIWAESTTFNHCFFILPLIGWLVWQRMPELRQLEPGSWAPGLVPVGLGAAAWLLGEAGSLGSARHFGLVLMLQGAAIACLGKAVSRGLAFPIFYAFFLLPFGEEAVPFLQTITAKLSMAFLGLAGVPATIDGIFITTPAGYFRVAEACSGVQFLIAMLAYGALVANTCFSSWRRRALFMLAALLIPILANGLRAAGTIVIAGEAGVEFAKGFDHVFYGWIFFGIVIGLLMAAGWRFFDRKADDAWFDPRALQAECAAPGRPAGLVRVAAAAAALAALAPFWSATIATASAHPAPADIALPDVRGWTRVPATEGRPWQPYYAGADIVRSARYRDRRGRAVDLHIILFARQREGRELVGYGQGAAARGGEWSWTSDSRDPPNGRGEIISSSGTKREVLIFYRIGDVLTGSRAAVKVETMRARLLGGPQHAVAVLVSAEEGTDGANARPAVDAFLSALGSVGALADRAAGSP